MNGRAIPILLITLCFAPGCATVSTPPAIGVPTLTPIPVPLVTLDPPRGFLPTPIADRIAPQDVPGCKDAQNLNQPVKFSWVGIEDVVQNTPELNWNYYRCSQSQVSLAAFYRQWMIKPPYNWLETYWEERTEVAMGVYYNNSGNATIPNRWLYLWFLPEKAHDQISYLVVAWWNVRPYC